MNISHQRGYVLYMSLVLLIGLMIFASVAVRSTTSEEGLARSYRNLATATQNAETQLIAAENSINPEAAVNEMTTCETLDAEAWADEQPEGSFFVQRLDMCEGNSSLSMGQSTTRQTDQMYRILATDYDDTRRSQVALETVFIP